MFDPQSYDLESFVRDSLHFTRRLEIVTRAPDLPASMRFDLARSSLNDDDLGNIAREFGAPDRNGWGFSSLLSEALSRNPDTIAIGDLKKLQQNLIDGGYVDPDVEATGVWDPTFQSGLSRMEQDNREEAMSGGSWMATNTMSAINFLGAVMPSRIYQSLVGQAKAIVTETPETAERLGAGGGFLAGAAIGAGVASIIPGVGTLAGAGVGGAIGATAGFFADLFGGGEGEEDQSPIEAITDPFIPNEYWTERQGAQKLWQDLGMIATVASIPSTVGLAAKGVGLIAGATGVKQGAIQMAGAIQADALAQGAGSTAATMTKLGSWFGKVPGVTPEASWWTRWLTGTISHGRKITPVAKTAKGAIAGAMVESTVQGLATMTGLGEGTDMGDVFKGALLGAAAGAVMPWLNPGSLQYLMKKNQVMGILALKNTNPVMKAGFSVYTGLSAQAVGGRYAAGFISGDYQTPMEKAIKESPELPEWVDLVAFAIYPEQFWPLKLGEINRAADKLMGDGHLASWVRAEMSTNPGISRKQALANVKEVLGPDEFSQRMSMAWLKLQNGIHNLAMDRVVKRGLTQEDASWLSAYNKERFAIQREILQASQNTAADEGNFMARQIMEEWSKVKRLDAISGIKWVPDEREGLKIVRVDDNAKTLIEKMRQKITGGQAFSNEGEGGFTVDLATGKFTDAGAEGTEDLYSIAMTHGMGGKGEIGRPDASILNDPAAFQEHVQAVITNHYPRLQQKNAHLGGWVFEGKLYIEPVEILKGQDKALRSAGLRGQPGVAHMKTLDDVMVPEEFKKPNILSEVMAFSDAHPISEESYGVYLHEAGSDVHGIRGYFQADTITQRVQRAFQEGEFVPKMKPGHGKPASADVNAIDARITKARREIHRLENESRRGALPAAQATQDVETIVAIKQMIDDLKLQKKAIARAERRDWTQARIIPERLTTPTKRQLQQYAAEYKRLSANVIDATFIAREPSAAQRARVELDKFVGDLVKDGTITEQWALKASRPHPDPELGRYIENLAKGAAVEVEIPEAYRLELEKLGYRAVLAGEETLRPNNITWLTGPEGIGDLTNRRAIWENMGLGLNRADDADLLRARRQYQEAELNRVAEKYELPLRGRDLSRRMWAALHELQAGRKVTLDGVLRDMRATPSDIDPLQTISKGLKERMFVKVDIRDLKADQVLEAIKDVKGVIGREDEIAKATVHAIKRGAAFGGDWAPIRAPLETARTLGHAMSLNGLTGFADLIRTWHGTAGRVARVTDSARRQILAYTPDAELVKIESRRNIELLHAELGARRNWDVAETQMAMIMLDSTAKGAVAAGVFPDAKAFFDSMDVAAIDRFEQLSGDAGWLLQTKRVADAFPEIFEGWQYIDIPGASPHLLPTVEDLMRSAKRGIAGKNFYEESQAVGAYHLSHGYTNLPGGEVRITMANATDAMDSAKEINLADNVATAVVDKKTLVVKVPPRQINNYHLWSSFVAPTSIRTSTGIGYKNALDGLAAAQQGPEAFERAAKHVLGLQTPEGFLDPTMDVHLSMMGEMAKGFTPEMWPRNLQLKRFKTYNFYRNHMERGSLGDDIRFIDTPNGRTIVEGWHGTDRAIEEKAGLERHLGTRRAAEQRINARLGDPDVIHEQPVNVDYVPMAVEAKFAGSASKPMSDMDQTRLFKDGWTFDPENGQPIQFADFKKKYDGIIYRNEAEDIGSLSAVVFESKKLTQLKTFAEESFAWTGDTHFWKRFGWEGQISMADKVDRQFFGAVDGLMQETAKKLGWAPKQLQAALWRDMKNWCDEMAAKAARAGNPALAKKFRGWSGDFRDSRNFAEAVAPGGEMRPHLEFVQEVTEARNQIDGVYHGYTQLQRIEGETLGAMKFGPDFQSAIRFFKSADTSTLTHEYSHLLRRVMPEDQLKVLADHLGIDISKQLTPEQEEKFVDLVTGFFNKRKVEPSILTPLETLKRSLGELWHRFRGYSAEKGLVDRESERVLDTWFGDVLPKTAQGTSIRPGARNLILGTAAGAAIGAAEGDDWDDVIKGALGGAVVAKGLRWAAGRNYGYLPEQLMNLSSAIRFSLSPAFDVRRWVKSNEIARARGDFMITNADRFVKTSGREWDHVVDGQLIKGGGGVSGQEAMDEAVAYFAWLYPGKAGYARTADDLDKLAIAQGLTGYSPLKRQVAYAWGFKQRGWADDKIRDELRQLFYYGWGRAPIEKSANFIFFPFSFEKKLLTNLGNWLLGAPGRNLLIHEGLTRYHEAGYDKEVEAFLEDHLPILKRMNSDFNAFAHGISPGQFVLQGLWDRRTDSAKAATAIAGFMAPGAAASPLANTIGQATDYYINAFVPLVLTGESIDRAGGSDAFLEIIGSKYVPLIKDLGKYWEAASDQRTATTQGESKWSQFRDYSEGMRQERRDQESLGRALGYNSMEGLHGSEFGAFWQAQYEAKKRELSGKYPTGFEMFNSYENTSELNKRAMWDLADKEEPTKAEAAILSLQEQLDRSEAVYTQLGLPKEAQLRMLTSWMRSQGAQLINDSRFVELWDKFFAYRFGPLRTIA